MMDHCWVSGLGWVVEKMEAATTGVKTAAEMEVVMREEDSKEAGLRGDQKGS